MDKPIPQLLEELRTHWPEAYRAFINLLKQFIKARSA